MDYILNNANKKLKHTKVGNNKNNIDFRKIENYWRCYFWWYQNGLTKNEQAFSEEAVGEIWRKNIDFADKKKCNSQN